MTKLRFASLVTCCVSSYVLGYLYPPGAPACRPAKAGVGAEDECPHRNKGPNAGPKTLD